MSTTRAATSTVSDSTNHRTTPIRVEERKTPANFTYVALKPMKVAGVAVNPGDIVTEAATWRNVHNYISAGYIALIATP